MSTTSHRPRLRAVVVGTGIRGAMFATGLAQRPDVDVVAVCDPSSPRLEEVAASVHATPFATVEDALAQLDDLNIAVIATPDFAHADPVVACAARGIAMLVEKPLATDVADAERMARAVRDGRAKVMVGFENRWNSRWAGVHDVIREGGIGEVTNVIMHLNDTVFVPTSMLSWAAQSSPAWFLMPHTLDLAMWLGGQRPVSVYATGVRRVLDADGTWDSITALFTMDGGQTVTLHSSWTLPVSMPAVFDFRAEVQATEGNIRVDGATHGISKFDGSGLTWPQVGLRQTRTRLDGAPIAMTDDFVEWVLGADVDVPSLETGILITRALAAVHRSLRESVLVTI